MISNAVKILKNFRSQGGKYSHISMIDPKGKFYLPLKKFEDFWKSYSDEVHDENIHLGIAEKPQDYLPVLADVDIEIKNEGQSLLGNIYTEDQVLDVIRIYQKVLVEIVEDLKDEHLICFLLEKDPYEKKDNIKNGFHLHFPYLFLSKSDQECFLIPRVKDKMKREDVFKDLGIDDSSKCIDPCPVMVSWLLYGSKKTEEMKPYKLTSVYKVNDDEELEEISLEDSMRNYELLDADERKIDIKNNLEFYLPRILSVIPFGRKVSELKQGIYSPTVDEILKAGTHDNVDRNVARKVIPVGESMEICKELIPMLGRERAEDRLSWLTVGWALYNIGDGCDDARKLWIDFSRKSVDKFSEPVCKNEWRNMIQRNITLGTLRYFAKTDNPEEYNKFVAKNMQEQVKKSLAGTHNEIAHILYEKYGTEFTCASITDKIWYGYKNHRWERMEKGVFLRKKISSDIAEIYRIRASELCKESNKDDDAGDRKGNDARVSLALKTANNLRSAPFKDNVMKEAMEVFYDPKFFKKLDSNPFLIGQKNGVYDCLENVFREGRPDDYISKQMGVGYREFNGDEEVVKFVERYLEQVFPDKELREYYLDDASDMYVGGNRYKRVMVWTGDGNNSKSVLQNITYKMLGEYMVKVPTSLITGKRTQSSSANPELARVGGGVRRIDAQEPDKKEVLNVGLIKELSGNDSFYARGLYAGGGDILPMFMMYIICNDTPIITSDDQAIWNRFRVLLFEALFLSVGDARIPETYEEQLREKIFPMDPNFEDRVNDEFLEAFNWILLKHRKKIMYNYSRYEPEKVKLATSKYRYKNNTYIQYEEEMIIKCEGNVIRLQELNASFKEWFKESIPHGTCPIKAEIKEYFEKKWGDSKGGKWKGYKFNNINDNDDDADGLLCQENTEEDFIPM